MEQGLESSAMHRASLSMISIAVSVLAHVSLMSSNASADVRNYTPAASVSPIHSTGLERPVKEGLRPG